MLYRIPGGRIAFTSAADAMAGVPAALDLVVVGALQMLFAARREREVLHETMRRWARRVVRRLRIKLEVRGLEHVGAGEQYVVAALHEGFVDVVALLHLPLRLRFTAREELSEWKLLGRVLAATDQIVVDTIHPVTGLRRLLRKGRAADAAGESIVIFPQGSLLGVEIAFRPGAARLAKQLGRRILPVVLTGSHRVWEYPFSSRVRFGEKITLEVLAPVDPGEFGKSEAVMKARALSEGRAPARRFDPERDGYWDGYAYDIDARFGGLAEQVRAHRSAN